MKCKDIENMNVYGLINLVVNTRLGIMPQFHFKIGRRHNGNKNIVSLRTTMESMAFFYYSYYYYYY